MKYELIKKAALIKYNETVEKYGGDNIQAVHWDDIQKQYIRFYLIKEHIPNDSEVSILDIGCGNGEFFKYLNFNGFRGKYTGYDINDKLIKSAKNIYPKYKNNFKVIDIFDDDLVENFDYVCVSGLFNNNLGQDEAWTKEFIRKMYDLANRKVIFNAISTYTTFRENNMYYMDPFVISDYIIKNLSQDLMLSHGQLPYNFQIVINKDKLWETIT